jgi:hypothetical protein
MNKLYFVMLCISVNLYAMEKSSLQDLNLLSVEEIDSFLSSISTVDEFLLEKKIPEQSISAMSQTTSPEPALGIQFYTRTIQDPRADIILYPPSSPKLNDKKRIMRKKKIGPCSPYMKGPVNLLNQSRKLNDFLMMSWSLRKKLRPHRLFQRFISRYLMH